MGKRKAQADSFLVLPVDPAAAFTFTWHPRFTEDGADVYFRQDGKRPLLVASDTFYEDIVPTSLSVIDFVCRSEEVPFPVPTCGLGYLFYREVRSLDRGKPPECRADTERYHLFTTPCCDGPQETWLYPCGDSAVLEIGTRTRLRKRYRLLYRTTLPKSVLNRWKEILQPFNPPSRSGSCGQPDADSRPIYAESPYGSGAGLQKDGCCDSDDEKGEMNYFRITKYDPRFREKGFYTRDDWTSIYDIGESCGGHIVTEVEYYRVENAYVQCYVDIIEKARVKVQIVQLERYKPFGWRNGQYLETTASVRKFITQCLREDCWGKMVAQNFFIHFGYDYYSYLGTRLPKAEVESIVRSHGLFCESFVSPYLDECV